MTRGDSKDPTVVHESGLVGAVPRLTCAPTQLGGRCTAAVAAPSEHRTVRGNKSDPVASRPVRIKAWLNEPADGIVKIGALDRKCAKGRVAPPTELERIGKRGLSATRELKTNREERVPVLVTGMHRSGTSWLGRMLCANGDFIHIPEPLNVSNRQTILRSRVRHWYTLISEENEDAYLPFYRDAVAFRPHPIHDIRRIRLGSPRDPIRIQKHWIDFVLGRLERRRVLFKDPFAIFSTEWFSRRLSCQIVVLIRHPLAVVSSLKRLGYSFDFNNILQQPLLMRRLERFRPEMNAALAFPGDIIRQGSLLWRIIYDSISVDEATASSLYIVRHEDLSLNPTEEYRGLYEKLGLSLTRKALRMIAKSTSDANPTEVSQSKPFKLLLDSRANLRNWRHRLEPDEIERILENTRPVVERYYPDGAWGE